MPKKTKQACWRQISPDEIEHAHSGYSSPETAILMRALHGQVLIVPDDIGDLKIAIQKLTSAMIGDQRIPFITRHALADLHFGNVNYEQVKAGLLSA
jgi:hypothetical protein